MKIFVLTRNIFLARRSNKFYKALWRHVYFCVDYFLRITGRKTKRVVDSKLEVDELLYCEMDSEWVTAVWVMTDRCNYRCSYCNPELHKGNSEVPFETVKEFLEGFSAYAKSQNKKTFVTFVGGEVSILPYFKELIELNDKLGVLPLYITNLSRPLSFWKTLPSSRMIFLASFHTEMTSENDFFEKLKYLDSLPHVQVCSDIMIPPTNEFDRFYSFALRLKEELKCAGIGANALYDNFATGHSVISPKYTLAQLEKIKSFKRRNEGKGFYFPRGSGLASLSDGSTLYYQPSELIISNKNYFKGWLCEAGKQQIVIDVHQRVWRCSCEQGAQLGTVENFDFSQLKNLAPTKCYANICPCYHDIIAPKKRVS